MLLFYCSIKLAKSISLFRKTSHKTKIKLFRKVTPKISMLAFSHHLSRTLYMLKIIQSTDIYKEAEFILFIQLL